MKLTVVTIQPGALIGTVELVDWDYEYIKKFVGGWIEHVTLSHQPPFGMYINEEGKLYEPPLPRNELATALYRRSRGMVGSDSDPFSTIEGPAVLVGGPDDEGDDTGLTDETLAVLHELGVINGTRVVTS